MQTLNSKLEILNKPKTQNSNDKKIYDLRERTGKFARRAREYVKTLPRTISNIEDTKQLVRASGSVGANYIEAEEALSKKDFVLRMKISRKESKESRYWFELTEPTDDQKAEKLALVQEATELMKIFGSIISRAE